MRNPLRSTLFPYTTLFRSEQDRGEHRQEAEEGGQKEIGAVGHALDKGNAENLGILGEPRDTTWHRDRKSTRLNSSHTVISYAVFCLKKKTKIKKTTVRTRG